MRIPAIKFLIVDAVSAFFTIAIWEGSAIGEATASPSG